VVISGPVAMPIINLNIRPGFIIMSAVVGGIAIIQGYQQN